MISESELKALIDSEVRDSVAYMGGKLSEMRRRNEYYYLGLAKGELAAPAIPGRSSVVSTDVADTVEWMLPGLMRIFAAGEDAVEFAPRKPEDEGLCKQATDYINYLFYSRNPGFEILYTWIKDALIQKVGIVKCWWDTTPEEKREEYSNLDPMQLAIMMQDPEFEVIEQTQTEAGFDVTAIRKVSKGRICIECVPPEEFIISRKAKSLEKPYFVAHRVERTVSDLKKAGYKNVDQLTSDEHGLNPEAVERTDFDDSGHYGKESADKSMRTVILTEAYVEVDYDGDGIAEWRKVVTAGNAILENEAFDGHPFVAIRPNPLPHRFFGLCPADMAVPSQKLKTSLKRAVLDNLYLQVNGRYRAIEGQVNLDDLMTSRPGGIVRVKSADAVGPLNQSQGDLGGAMQFLEFEEREKENRTGFTRYSQGTDANALNKTATGISIITGKSDARVELMARCIAEGVRDLFKMMLKLSTQYQDRADVIRLNNQWVPMDPRTWSNEYDVIINVGLGTSNKDQVVAQLMALKQDQANMLQFGVAKPENLYTSSLEIAKNMGLRNPERFYFDPRQNPPPQPPPPDPRIIAEQQKAQLEMAKTQLEAKTQADQMQLQFAELQQRMKEWSDKFALEVEKLSLEKERIYKGIGDQTLSTLAGIQTVQAPLNG